MKERRINKAAIAEYILESIDLNNYGIKVTNDTELVEGLMTVFRDEYKERIEEYGMESAFRQYLMACPSSIRVAIADYEIKDLLRSWDVPFWENDPLLYKKYTKILQNIVWDLCHDMGIAI